MCEYRKEGVGQATTIPICKDCQVERVYRADESLMNTYKVDPTNVLLQTFHSHIGDDVEASPSYWIVSAFRF